MGRTHVDPLRAPTAEERTWLTRLSRARAEPAAHVARATALLAVADGASYTDAAHIAGRRSGDAVAHLVARFNREGLAAIAPRHGGGHTPVYAEAERARIVAEAQRVPDPATDGTATWSLTTLQRALRRAPEGLPTVSTYTIWQALHAAGLSWQHDRSWCTTGRVLRKRKAGVVEIDDVDAAPKKS
jgi:transposase